MTTGTLRYRSRGKRYWDNYDPVLGKNEFGFVEPSNKFKIGNGFSKFSELDFVGTGGSGGPATLPARLAEASAFPTSAFDLNDYTASGFYPITNYGVVEGVPTSFGMENAPAEVDSKFFVGSLVVVSGQQGPAVISTQTLTGFAVEDFEQLEEPPTFIWTRMVLPGQSSLWTMVGSIIT